MANRASSHVRWQILYLVAAFFLHALMIYWAITRQQERIYIENGWLENLQILYLALAAIGFVISGKLSTDHHSSLFYFLSVVPLLFIIREVEFADFTIPGWMKFMLAREGRAIFYIIAIALFIKPFRQFREYWCKRRIYIRSSLFGFLAASGFFLLVFSLTFDRQFFDIAHYQLLEEASEAIAYILMLGAALFGYAGIRRSDSLQISIKPDYSDDIGLESLFHLNARLLPSQKNSR